MNIRLQFDEAKLAELILYISERCKESQTFGATLLNKILFYSDFLYFGHFGKSITGTTYVHRSKGPAPSPQQFLPVRDSLIAQGRLKLEESTFGGYTQKRTVALDPPRIDAFSDAERSFIDYVIDALKGQTATAVSDYSHNEVPWLLTEDGEEIPYYTVFIRRYEPIPMEYLSRIQEAAIEKGIE